MEVAVRVQDPSGTVAKDVNLQAQDASTVRELVQVLVDVMEWPRTALSGEPLAYRLSRAGKSEPLDEAITLISLNLSRGETLILGSVPKR